MSRLEDGRKLYREQHPQRTEPTTGQQTGDQPVDLTGHRKWTMEDLLTREIDQGRCLWEAQHGNPHARAALEELRQAVAGLRQSVADEAAPG